MRSLMELPYHNLVLIDGSGRLDPPCYRAPAPLFDRFPRGRRRATECLPNFGRHKKFDAGCHRGGHNTAQQFVSDGNRITFPATAAQSAAAGQQFMQRWPPAAAGEFEELTARREELDRFRVCRKLLAQEDRKCLALLTALHLEEVDEDPAGKIPHSELARDLCRRFTIDLRRPPGSRACMAPGIDVDGR